MKSIATTSVLPTPATRTSLVFPTRARTLRYIGGVSRATTERVLKDMGRLIDESPEETIMLVVTSNGGPTGSAMNFFDTVRYVLAPRLIAIGSGDVDSSGVIIFLSGEERYVTARTTLLLHSAGRVFGNQRYTTREMESMLAEDRLKDTQYAQIVAERSRGRLTREDVLELMQHNTVLSPADAVRYGLADAVLA